MAVREWFLPIAGEGKPPENIDRYGAAKALVDSFGIQLNGELYFSSAIGFSKLQYLFAEFERLYGYPPPEFPDILPWNKKFPKSYESGLEITRKKLR